MTPSEARIWTMIRTRQLGVRFRRQHPIGDYIVDFASVEAALIVEADGGQRERSVNDLQRDQRLRNAGFRVLRFWNEDVARHPDWVEATIKEWVSDPSRGLDGERYPD